MRARHAALCLLALLVLQAAPAAAQCGGICLYEVGSADLGRAAAGAGALASDASTALWNPAGLTELEGSQVMLGLVGVFPELNPELSGRTISPDPAPNGGGDAADFAPLVGGYISAELPWGLHFGLASTALFGGGTDYDGDWTGRSFVTDNSLTAFLIQPSLAYAFTDWLSLGAGPAILYTSFEQRLKITALPGEPTAKIANADDWSAGAAVSALLKPREGTRIGVSYRSEIQADTSGRLEGPSGLNPVIDTDFTFPQGVNLSLFQQVTDTWALLADVGWSDWSRFGNIPLQIGAIAGTQRRRWDDTWRVGAGFQYAASETLTLQGGFSYDSSPVQASRLLPDIPASEQYRFAAGLLLRPKPYVELSMGYQFLWFGDMEIDQVALPGGVILDGEYDPAHAHQLGTSLTVKF
ncbi:MAG: OmpP1/FadL family transporter [Myxococcota bacterium]